MITADHKTGVSGPFDFHELYLDMLTLFNAAQKYDDWNAAMVGAMSSLGGSVFKIYRNHLRNDKCPE